MTTQDHLKVTAGATGLFNRIRSAIINGDYAYNERLPSERALAEQFSVARGTVRAALNQLERANFVRKKFGSCTFINYDIKFDQEDISEETSPLDLIETRLAIEPHIVRLVVSNANNRELRKLQEMLDHSIHSKQDANSFSSADETFHLMLANYSQNPLLIWVYQRINDIRSHSQWSHRKQGILTQVKIAEYNQQHKNLLNAILRRDVEYATALMVQHLNQAKRDLEGA